jgi:hypothetical protein
MLGMLCEFFYEEENKNKNKKKFQLATDEF